MLKEKYKYPEDFCFVYNGKLLEENNRLYMYNIDNSQYITIILKSQLIPIKNGFHFLKIKVKINSKDEFFYFQCYPKIMELKKYIKNIYHIEPDNQIILLNGKNLLNNSEIIEIYEPDFLQLKIRSDYDVINITVKYKDNIWNLNVGINTSSDDLIDCIKNEFNFKFEKDKEILDIYFLREKKRIMNLKRSNILDGDVLDMIIDYKEEEIYEDNIYVFVKLPNGRGIRIETNLLNPVYYLKQKIQDKEGFPPFLQRISKRDSRISSEFEDKKTLDFYGIKKDSTVYLRLKSID